MPFTGAGSLPLWINLALFAGAAILVWTRGVRLTRHLDAIASKTGLNRAFVGMLFLGGITSLPELANVLTASTIGNPALAINNLIGSAAINVVLLAIADALIGKRALTSIVAKPSTMMMAALCMLVLVLISAVISLGDTPVFGLGVGSVIISAASIFSFWLATGYDERSPWKVQAADRGGETVTERSTSGPHMALSKLWLRTALDGVLIFVGGYALSMTGDAIASQTGIGSELVGFALIGIATSTPEMSTIVTALRLRQPEMAFGQVMGTNFINLSMFAVADAAFEGGTIIEMLGQFEVIAALLAALVIGIFLVGLLEHKNRTVLKMGYDSAAVILLFGTGLALLALI